MLTEKDTEELRNALDWASQKTPSDQKKSFVFSSADAACEVSKILPREVANGVKVTCNGPVVSVTRPDDPDIRKRVKQVWEANE